MKPVKLAAALAVWFCVGTVLAEAGLLGALTAKGWLTRQRLALVAAALDGKTVETPASLENANTPPATKQTSDETEKLAAAFPLLVSRAAAADDAAEEVRNMEARLATDRQRFDEMMKSFDQALATLEQETLEAGRQDLRQTLENMSPKQAKDHLLRMFADGAGDDLVSVFTSLSVEKRKKIVGEFRTPAEQQTLHEILRDVRLTQSPSAPTESPSL